MTSAKKQGPTPAEILSVGLVTPVGLYAAAASTAISAGRSRARKWDFVNRTGEGQAMHLVEEEYLEPLHLGLSTSGMTPTHHRLLQLGGAALAEAAAPSPAPAPLFLALPEKPKTDGASDFLGSSFLHELAIQAGVHLDEERSAVYRQGGAGPLFALRDALLALASGEASHVLVGGLDTFLNFERLARLDSEGRLYGPRSRLGFMPGEGAGFLLLRGGRSGAAPIAEVPRLIAVGTGQEEGHRYSDKPYRGDGLSEAFEELFSQVPQDTLKVRCVFAGYNGEEMPAKEWGVARLRHSDRFTDELDFRHPADCIGDAGAALGAIMLGLAALAITQGHLPEPRPIWATEDPGPCLVWTTSDLGPRAAALVQW